MPNVRMTSAQMKAKAKAAAAKNKAKSKMGSPANRKGKTKPAAAVKNRKVYKTIKSTSTYTPKFEKVSDEKLELGSPAKKVVRGKIKLKSGTVIKSKENTKTGKYKETIKKKGQKKIVNKGKESPMKKTKQKVEQDYARNAIADYKSGKTKEAKYEKKKALELAAGESGVMMKGSPYHKHGSPYHMGHKDSPMNKALVGNQKNLPEHLKKKIEAAPQMKGSPYHMSDELKYGGPVIDQMKTLSQVSASKVLRHMKK